VLTARKDRNLLSIVLDISSKMMLGEKEIANALAPLLDKLHYDGMLKICQGTRNSGSSDIYEMQSSETLDKPCR
jgi:hypothetical protein